MENNALVTLRKSLSPVHVCALALGCIIGWTAFHEPGAIFLREAGTLGTILAIGIAALAMLLIAVNYGFMVNQFPVAGGEFAYARAAFGRRHSFVCAWFLGLAYLSCIPLNATAIGFFAHMVFHDTLSVGPHWNLAGHETYLSVLALSELALLLVALLCVHGVRDTGFLQTVLVLALVGGAAVVAGALAVQPSAWREADPALHPVLKSGPALRGFFAVLSVAAGPFIGFDTVPQGVEEFAFPHRRTLGIMTGSILAGTALYVALTLVAAAAPAPDSADQGIQAIPAFHAAHRLLGGTGVAFLAYATLAAALTGIIGFLMAESRLLWSMAREGMLSPWFGKVSPEHRTPRNAILFVAGVSAASALFGRGMLRWFVDLCSLGAAIGYGYTSAAAFRFARRQGNRAIQLTGAVGMVIALLFAVLLLVPIPGLECSMKPPTYALLLVWIALGMAFRVIAKRRDRLTD